MTQQVTGRTQQKRRFLGTYRLLVPFDYNLTDDEKAKYAGKLPDKHIVITVPASAFATKVRRDEEARSAPVRRYEPAILKIEGRRQKCGRGARECLSPLRGLLPFCLFPTADAVGYCLAPLRGGNLLGQFLANRLK
jgi:hypothetical protein